MTKVMMKMIKFQEANKIENKCVDNTLYLRDCLLANGMSARVEPCYAIWLDDDACGVVVHLVVNVMDLDGIMDPSYDVWHHKQIEYVKSFSDIPSTNESFGLSRREMLENFLKLKEVADRVNRGEFLLTNPKYYQAQADYCEGKAKSVYWK